MVGLGRPHPPLSAPVIRRAGAAVAIARAIATDPAILVADEPTGDLDKTSAEEVLDLMERLNRELRKTILMVTHDPRAAERAHWVTRHLEKGELA